MNLVTRVGSKKVSPRNIGRQFLWIRLVKSSNLVYLIGRKNYYRPHSSCDHHHHPATQRTISNDITRHLSHIARDMYTFYLLKPLDSLTKRCSLFDSRSTVFSVLVVKGLVYCTGPGQLPGLHYPIAIWSCFFVFISVPFTLTAYSTGSQASFQDMTCPFL